MPTFFDLFRRGRDVSTPQEDIVEGLNTVQQTFQQDQMIHETLIREDNRAEDSILEGTIQSVSRPINEGQVGFSPDNLAKMLANEDTPLSQVLTGLRTDLSMNDTFQENEEMSKDSVIGAVMEIIADDACQADERTGKVVIVESEDENLQRFLDDFLVNNVNIEDRIWTWTYEIVKHGDFKLRRREYYAGSKNSGIKNVYYEDVLNPYLVSRIEYMGNVIGYEDEDIDNPDPIMGASGAGVKGQASFERADEFVHFVSSKLSRREKLRLNVRGADDKIETVTCYKVVGTSLVDNARYIFRVINMLDNMLILSRVARSTQYNLVKVEVGNASPGKTQQILMDIRRRIEGSTKLRKNAGMKTDPSPIPINSNVYLPTRDGKGDVTIDSVGDNVDVRSIVDIDYFRDKEFAALKVPKQYLGFEDALNGTLGNNSLVKMDIRYARSVQRVSQIMQNGIKALCNNYLLYRGRREDVNKFRIRMRPIVTSENAGRIEELITNFQAFDSMSGVMQEYGSYIDKAKMFRSMLGLIGLSPAEIGSKEFLQILKEIEDGTYDEDNHKQAAEDDDEGGGGSW